MEDALYIHEVCSAMAIKIGVEGGRMMPKWGNKGKLARMAKIAMEFCDRTPGALHRTLNAFLAEALVALHTFLILSIGTSLTPAQLRWT